MSYKINYKNVDTKMINDNPKTFTVESDVVLVKPIRDGYIFGGWYTDSKFTSPIEVIDSTTGKNVTIYAKWIKE